jgi:hypothetical protein
VTEHTAADEGASELTVRIQAALERLGGQELAEHPAAYESMDADIRAALGAGELA